MLVVFNAMSKRTGTMLDSDVPYQFRLQLFDHAREVGVSAACRTFGVHRSTYYRGKTMVERSGLEMLRPRERRRPRMPNQTNPVIEARVRALAIANPGLGPPASTRPWRSMARSCCSRWASGPTRIRRARIGSALAPQAVSPGVTARAP